MSNVATIQHNSNSLIIKKSQGHRAHAVTDEILESVRKW